jgi:hypothetical protein
MDISRRNLLLTASTAALFGSVSSRARAANAPKYFIVVLANGGWDVTYCLDCKVGALTDAGEPTPIEGPEKDEANPFPELEKRGTFGNLTVTVNEKVRPNVSTFFGGTPEFDVNPRYTGCHIVNGIWTGSIAHAPCRMRMFAGTTYEGASDPATMFGYETGQDLPLGTVDMSGLSFPGALAASTGRIGFQSQITALTGTDPANVWKAPGGGAYARQNSAERELVFQYLNDRAATFRGLRGEGDGGHNSHLVDGLLESLKRSKAFNSQSQEAMADLQLGLVPSFDDQIGMALDLLKENLCRSVVLNTGSDWDTHIANSIQQGFYNQLFGAEGSLDPSSGDPPATGLTRLYDDLKKRGMFEDTVVAVISEMTRTPQFNLSQGKDHHAHTSALFFGGPVRGNATSGATDNEFMESKYVDLATGEVSGLDPRDPTGKDPTSPDATYNQYDTLNAGLVKMLGLDNELWFPNVTPFEGFIAKT